MMESYAIEPQMRVPMMSLVEGRARRGESVAGVGYR